MAWNQEMKREICLMMMVMAKGMTFVNLLVSADPPYNFEAHLFPLERQG